MAVTPESGKEQGNSVFYNHFLPLLYQWFGQFLNSIS
jgi:hypothetical protein